MTGFRTWVKKCFDNVIDPDKDAEVGELMQLLHQGIQEKRNDFNLSNALAGRPYKERHLQQAKIDLYKEYLRRAWADGRITSAERDSLGALSKVLELSESTVRDLNLQPALPKFAESLAQAMDDGVISASEAAELRAIAGACGRSLRELMKSFFQTQGERFLQGIFAAATANDGLSTGDFDRLVQTAEQLGLSRDDLLDAIQSQALRLIEHALADAKQDDALSAGEATKLKELLKILRVPPGTEDYVLREMEELCQLTEVRSGRLPSLAPPDGIAIRAGELVHHHDRASWEFVKVLKSGPSHVSHEGTLTITDSRLLFTSSTRSEAIGFRKIIAHEFTFETMEIQTRGKPTDRFTCGTRPRLVYAIFRSALAMANQTLTNQDESRRTRHIARDIRQRVWQQYGGRCAECMATAYLEFDHIVPVAKGGSNSEANVQLLCRNCNLKKSDLI